MSTWLCKVQFTLEHPPTHSIDISIMPLIASGTFKIPPPSLPMVRGRKPLSLLDILDQTPSGYATNPWGRKFDSPTTMSEEQMLAYYKLCLYNYVAVCEGRQHNLMKTTHSSFIETTRIRKEFAKYTGALLEGMVCVHS